MKTKAQPDPNSNHKPNQDPETIKRLTERAVEQIYPSKEFLLKLLKSGKRLSVYQGFDPTADTLHIGSTVGMRKLRDFQLLGHRAIFLIGDFTGRVGDPSDKSATRQQLTKEQIENNMKEFKEQASKILDFDDKENPAEVLYNSHWLEKLDFTDLLDITTEFTVQQMIKRDMVQQRLEEEKPIRLHEFLYPVMQSYDSIAMNIDVEVGGNDQTFNMLCGRDLTRKLLKKEKCVLANKLLVDTGGKKMGKTEGNMAKLSDMPEDMYGKVMAFTDGMIIPGFEILTDVPMDEITQMDSDMNSEKVNPMELKKKLAFTITAEHKGQDAAKKAQKHFESVFQEGAQDSESIQEISVAEKEVRLVELLVEHTKFSDSNSNAKRLIEQGAVSIDGDKITDKNASVEMKSGGLTLRAGKKIARLTHK